MKTATRVTILAVALGLTSSLVSAQEGNGFGNATIENTPALLGDSLTLRWGSPGLSGALAFLTLSPSYGPTPLPGLTYDLWLDIYHPALINIPHNLDANGEGALNIPLAAVEPLAAAAPWYGYIAVVDPSLPPAANGISFSKTIRIAFENPNSSQPAGDMITARAFHDAAPMGSGPRDNDTSVFVAGGAQGSALAPQALASTEIYRPMFRAFEAGPGLQAPRAAHQMVKLLSGHILIIGGLDGGNLAQASCELFDPATETLFPIASMAHPRAGHAATLLADGRVLVTGGLTDWTDANNQLIARLSTAQTTAEIFDPATGVWTEVGAMATRRMGHAQTLLPDGRVLVSGGVTGGQPGIVTLFGGFAAGPVMTGTCEVFDPTTNNFSAAPNLAIARAFHSATHLPGRGVLAAGGAAGGTDGSTVSQHSCELLDPALSAWTATANLTTTSTTGPSAFHRAELLPSGDVLIVGGLSDVRIGTALPLVGVHDGTTFTPGRNLGENPGRAPFAGVTGAHAMVRLYDGTYLVTGGGAGTTLARSLIYIPDASQF